MKTSLRKPAALKTDRSTRKRSKKAPVRRGERPKLNLEVSDRLATYEKKRRFDRTPEPSGERPNTGMDHPLEFVVQKHDATRLHYDVRIEIAGAMMSWAVPKGPSFDPSVKRLAIETEDHPMAYNQFEGRIPDGEYGAGDVLIWDRGTYETVPSGRAEEMRKKGHLHVRFAGDKLVGDWHFVRTTGRGDGTPLGGKNAWLMFKAQDEYADPGLDIVASRPGSVVSGKSATRGPARRRASRSGHSAKNLLSAVGLPMRAVLPTNLVNPDEYVYEVKFDGYRLLAARAGADVELITRTGDDSTARFPPIVRALGALAVREAVLDGEACVLDDQGLSSFRMLQSWLGGDTGQGTLAFIAFDLMWLDGRDLREHALEERRDLLEALLRDAKPPLVFSRTLKGPLSKLEPAAKRSGLEGLIAKKKRSTYASEGGTWWKLAFRKDPKDRRRELAERPAASPEHEAKAAMVTLTNPDKVLFPRDGITKSEIAAYYGGIADLMLPYLKGRPLGLQRWPNGIDGEAWFQQKAPEKVPDFVRVIGSGERHGGNRKIIAENRETLLWLANLAALTIHQWASHVPDGVTKQTDIERALGLADYTVLDLDPGDGPWEHVISVANALRELLEKLELESVVKTSGQRGLHVLIPFRRGPDHEAATQLGRKLAATIADGLPEIATVERMKAKRGGRLYVDFLQNGEGKTIVAPYTIRAKDGAPVSLPIRWSEVTNKLNPGDFTLRTALARADKVGDLLAPLLSPRQTIPTIK